MNTRVTVGLCFKKSGNIVDTALDSISKQNYPHENVKLVIVEEDGNDVLLRNLNVFVRNSDISTEVISLHNKGLGASRQIVVDNAEGDYVVWVDDDFVLKEDFISKHVEFMSKNPNIGAALAHENLVKRKPTSIVALFENYHEVLRELNGGESPAGGFEIYRLKAVKQVGGFDANIKGAGEDRDISIRLRNAGWILAKNNSAEYYRKHFPTTWKTLWNKRFWYGYGQHFLFHKHQHQKFRWELFFPSAFWIGFKDSLKIYRFIGEKKVFLLSLYYLFSDAASFVGFLQADINGYGHMCGNTRVDT